MKQKHESYADTGKEIPFDLSETKNPASQHWLTESHVLFYWRKMKEEHRQL